MVRTRLIPPPPVRCGLLPEERLCSQCWCFRTKVKRRGDLRFHEVFAAYRRQRLQSAPRAADTRDIDREHPFLQPGTPLRVLPTVAVVGVAWALAWSTNGSIDAGDWLPYALIVAAVLAVALLTGAAVRPRRLPLLAGALLVGFGLWTAVSIAWSPLPSLARDDALLTLLYAGAFLTPLLTLRTQADRLLAATVAVGALGLLAVVTALEVQGAAHAADVYTEARLDFPVSYWNGTAALFLVGLWPAIALSADRRLGPAVRALSLAAATAMVTGWLMTQSKGGGVALAVSGIVFLAVARERLRALVPVLVVGALAAAGAGALTAPYRSSAAGLLGAIHHAGTVALVLTGIGLAVGLVYAPADRRLLVPRSFVLRLGKALAITVSVGALAAVAGFFIAVDHPIGFVEQRWASFKHLPKHETASTHFTSIGSNRYDYWRVALIEFDRQPLIGVGGHGWPAAYLRYGRTSEAPERSHSLELDALSETGIIGFLLVLGAGVLGLAAVSRRSGAPLLPAALLGSGAYLATHTAIDWVWSIPSVGLSALVLVGIGASRGTRPVLSSRPALVGGTAVIAVALIGFAPPWLSARLTDRAYGETPVSRTSTLDWAERLDPLSVDPLLTQAALARSPHDIASLRRALALQPGDSEVHYLLGLAYLTAHHLPAARKQLGIAARLSPRDPAIRSALRRASTP
jgi:O-antigen ligase